MNKWIREGTRWQGRGYSLIREFRRLQKRKKTIKKTNPLQMNSEEITTALRTLKGYRTGSWQRINLDNFVDAKADAVSATRLLACAQARASQWGIAGAVAAHDIARGKGDNDLTTFDGFDEA